MGDVIHALPAVAALRDAMPDAHLGWLIEQRWSELLCAKGFQINGPRAPHRPLIDQVHCIDTKRWRKSLFAGETRRDFRSAVAALRRADYDTAVDFQGLIRSAVFARLSGAKGRFGFQQPRESAARWFYTDSVVAQGAHVIEQNCSLAENIVQLPSQIPNVPLPIDENAEHRVSQELTARGMNRFAILNPGAGWGAKQWSPKRYGEVAARLGLPSLINFGPGEESLALAVETASRGAAQRISLSLGELISLTRRASLFIGGDTGPMHLASGLKIPVVAIFGPTGPARNGPFGNRNVVIRSPASATNYSHSATSDSGMLQIGVDEVVRASQDLMGAA